MKTADYIFITLYAAAAVGGIFLGGFPGGFVTGVFVSLLLFTTVGKIVFNKSQKRIDAAMRMKRLMEE